MFQPVLLKIPTITQNQIKIRALQAETNANQADGNSHKLQSKVEASIDWFKNFEDALPLGTMDIEEFYAKVLELERQTGDVGHASFKAL